MWIKGFPAPFLACSVIDKTNYGDVLHNLTCTNAYNRNSYQYTVKIKRKYMYTGGSGKLGKFLNRLHIILCVNAVSWGGLVGIIMHMHIKHDASIISFACM